MSQLPLKKTLLIASMVLCAAIVLVFYGGLHKEVRIYGVPVFCVGWWLLSTRILNAVIKE